MISKMTHAKTLTINEPSIELSRKNCLGIFINAEITVENGSSTSTTVKIEDILNKIRFDVRKNNKTALVEMNAFNLALLNLFDANGYLKIDGTISIQGDSTAKVVAPLYVDGPFRGAEYSSFDISMSVNQSIGDNLTIKSINAEVTGVYTDMDFGDTIIERTKNWFKTSFNAGSYREVLQINSINAIQQAIIIIRDKNGTRSDNIVEKIGLRNIGTEKTDIMELGYNSAIMVNKMIFTPKTRPVGVIYMDFTKELTLDEYGIKAWRLGNDKLYLALESSDEGTVEVITKELIVNSELIDNPNPNTDKAEIYDDIRGQYM
ncbi:hypothetical protein [Methanocaldococcus sp.]